ncbi:MAG: hypothetical protein NC908_05105, partial [Candidatus Omnitrophica bacterium]|nr:hypothetical protein [Candidatus Omnitrophota bacterium]
GNIRNRFLRLNQNGYEDRRAKNYTWEINAEDSENADLSTMTEETFYNYLLQAIGEKSGEAERITKVYYNGVLLEHSRKIKKAFSLRGEWNEAEVLKLRKLLLTYQEKRQRLNILSPFLPKGFLFWPRPEFDYDYQDKNPFNPTLIKTSRTKEEVLELLRQAKQKGIELSIIGHLRGVDGCGSSLDLPEFQIKLTPQGVTKLEELPSTPTIASKFIVKITFKLAEDPKSIVYVASDFRYPSNYPITGYQNKPIDENRPYVNYEPIELTKEARTPYANLDAPAYIFRNLFGLSGIKIICEAISPMALAGGMESSNVFNVALIAAASILSGADLSLADIFSLAVRLENNEFAGLTGGQGHLCCMLGGAYRHIWLSGKEGVYGAFSIPLLRTKRDFKEVEKHMMLVQAGKEYKDGKAVVGRTAALINNMWTDLLRDEDEVGLPLHQEKLALTATYTQALKGKNWQEVVSTLRRYVEIRDALCIRWINLMLDAHQGKKVPHYAKEYARKVFDPSHPEYSDYQVIRDLYEAHGENLKNISPYTLEPISTLVNEAAKQNIAIMPLGAGGPGANLIAVSAIGKNHLESFLKSKELQKLTEKAAKKVIRGTGTLKGYIPFRIGRKPLQFNGFKELGLKLPEGPQKINPYPLPVPEEAQTQSEQKYGKNRILTDVLVSGFDLRYSKRFRDNHYEGLKQRLEELRQLLGRAPPEIKSWRLIITTDLALTQGNVASCDITSKTVFIHPYFFSLPEAKQTEILYHELISHLTKGITDEDKAMKDTLEFIVKYLLSTSPNKRKKIKYKVPIGEVFLEIREGGNVTIDITRASIDRGEGELDVPNKKDAMEDFLRTSGFNASEGIYIGNETSSLEERDGIVATIDGLKVFAVDEDQSKVAEGVEPIGKGIEATLLKQLVHLMETMDELNRDEDRINRINSLLNDFRERRLEIINSLLEEINQGRINDKDSILQKEAQTMIAKYKKPFRFMDILKMVLFVFLPFGLTVVSTQISKAEDYKPQIKKFLNWLSANRDRDTGLPHSHVGDDRFQGWAITYDSAVVTLAYIASGRIEEAKKVIDFYIDTPNVWRLGGIIEAVCPTNPVLGEDWSVRTGSNLWMG